MRVKICGLTRATDVEKAIELGADALGFIFEKTSPRYISEAKSQELVGLSEPFSTTVAVYGRYNDRLDSCSHVQAVEWRDKAGLFGALSTHRYMEQDVRPAFWVFRFSDGTGILDALNHIDERHKKTDTVGRAIVLDGLSAKGFGGTGTKVDWDLAAEIVRSCHLPVILAGGLTPDNVAIAVAKVKPYAVDVSSGIESSPGIKDHAKMRDFIQAAREASGV